MRKLSSRPLAPSAFLGVMMLLFAPTMHAQIDYSNFDIRTKARAALGDERKKTRAKSRRRLLKT